MSAPVLGEAAGRTHWCPRRTAVGRTAPAGTANSEAAGHTHPHTHPMVVAAVGQVDGHRDRPRSSLHRLSSKYDLFGDLAEGSTVGPVVVAAVAQTCWSTCSNFQRPERDRFWRRV